MSVLALAIPAMLAAQSGQAATAGSANASQKAGANQATSASSTAPHESAKADAKASANAEFHAPSSFSADGQAKLNAMYADAKAKNIPREPMAKRVDEGKAKGANETAIIASAGKVKGHLEASQKAMIKAGHEHPTDEETTHAANAMDKGVTSEQITAMAKTSNGEKALVVAFDNAANAAVSSAGGVKGSVSSTTNVASKPAGTTVSTTVGGVVKKP
jgi:hypothetical protein